MKKLFQRKKPVIVQSSILPAQLASVTPSPPPPYTHTAPIPHDTPLPVEPAPSYVPQQYVAPARAPVPVPVQTAPKNMLIVGIDFGTTYSGVAYVWATGNKAQDLKPNPITEWIGQGNMTQAKIETVLYYDKNGNVVGWALDSDKCFNGAGHLKPGIFKAHWFKMHLQADTANSYISTRDLPQLPPNMTAVDVAADYLTLLREAIDKELSKRLATVYTREKENINYFVTVPAMWNDAGKNLTRQAAVKAGFVPDMNDRRLKLITEPEAAAIYCAKYCQLELTTGDVFLIVDCGGGTVDLVTYEIEDTSPFAVRECTVPTGDACGATRVVEEFSALAFEKINRLPLAGPDAQKVKQKCYERCIADFDNRIKKGFANKPGKDWLIELGMEIECEEADVIEGRMLFTNEEIVSAFRQAVELIVHLVKEQINLVEKNRKQIEAILLVGGFGASQYLFDYIKNQIPPKYCTKLVRPPDSVAAIVQGAVTTGIFDRVVTARRARRHYMLETVDLFVPNRHPAEYRIPGLDGTDRCRYTKQVFISKGQRLEVGRPITVHLRRQIDMHAHPRFEDALYYCDQDTCPEYVTRDGIFPLGTLTMDLTSVDSALFNRRHGQHGQDLYDIEFEVSMWLEGGDALRAESTFKGQVVGRTTVDFR
ncbi:uncharacterized protein V1518DRAFT_389589 [Limtongia smithiae]|uniref:uncharacterized protein n=1 Tax=Limtongia smithiae TaxID=1125753 RepID=UPI0034CEB651